MSVELSTLDSLVEAYKQHQRRTRGLRGQTLHGYERLVRLFVRAALGDDPIDPDQRARPHDARAVHKSTIWSSDNHRSPERDARPPLRHQRQAHIARIGCSKRDQRST
jgi:hypothetical protein